MRRFVVSDMGEGQGSEKARREARDLDALPEPLLRNVGELVVVFSRGPEGYSRSCRRAREKDKPMGDVQACPHSLGKPE